MKTKNLIASLFLGIGLVTAAFSAQGGPPAGKGNGRPDTAPTPNPDACPYIVNGECPGGQVGCPQDCPQGNGVCPNTGECPKTDCPAGPGTCPNPDAQPKRDGTGGPGKPANPAGPQDGSAPGQGRRGGRG